METTTLSTNQPHKGDKRFLIEYGYAGSTWMFELWADDWPDAERKLRALKTNARVIGDAVMQIKVPGIFTRLAMWLTKGQKP